MDSIDSKHLEATIENLVLWHKRMALKAEQQRDTAHAALEQVRTDERLAIARLADKWAQNGDTICQPLFAFADMLRELAPAQETERGR